MDSAFDRRFLYKVEFVKPSSQTRAKIWKAKLPKLKESDINAITHYDLSGGQIENVSRKFMLDTILNLKEFDIQELKKLCENEASFKKDATCKVIGFAA
jgi:SpoVK/Ycf46/Vps4 family AAA+-type ATPase